MFQNGNLQEHLVELIYYITIKIRQKVRENQFLNLVKEINI
jgi:hypothetical protein